MQRRWRPAVREMAEFGRFEAPRLARVGREVEGWTVKLPGGSTRRGEAHSRGTQRRPVGLGFARGGDTEEERGKRGHGEREEAMGVLVVVLSARGEA